LVDLSVLTAGPPPPNPQELLSRPAFPKAMAEFAEQFDVVIIDTPAADISADAQTLAVQAGGALLLARQDRTRLQSFNALAGAVVSTGGQIVGTVLARF
jgi:receptor protein-tyrosine kinase